ncbi:TonB-dependent vitamin B12 receptor [Cognatilysobacter bugurensis]|uniref:TonB-dependent vitamin B12 receptor n=1 Tax=Cognatilysobacter bugurensis TaxID=543356 RepID=A0A918T009_9GAMM|nr:TonB-dependent vitamin B12 receptor [Lysobacter bugurensis]GHA80608.1 TonB-dependent vitamin B12 receptor [Lysobacter bugurensis]
MQSRLPVPFRAAAVPSALAVALSALIAPAHAAPDATDLDEVVVTATRTARTQDQTLASVTVIDREQIERLQPLSLPDLLRGLPGISIANNGGPGKATSLFLRGTESDHTLVLIDGLRLGSATTGGASLQDIPVDQIERIEIVRGPFSSLYGADAIGGVIQIFTRRPQTGFAPNASVSVGSFDTLHASAGIAGRSDAGWYSLQAAHVGTEGINAMRTDLSADLDGYYNDSLSLRVGTRVAEAWTLEAHALQANTRNEYDGSFNNLTKGEQRVVGGRARFSPSAAFALTFQLGRTADLSDNFGDFSTTFDTVRELGSVQADIGIEPGLLTLGADWRSDEVATGPEQEPYDVTQRITRGAFAQWQQEFGAHALQLNARHDDDTQFGGHTTGSALWGWELTDSLRLTASAGTAFKAPTFNELYFPNYGNPRLAPEASRSVELGLRGHHDSMNWGLSAFETRVDDLIAYDATLTDDDHPFGQPNNIEEARIRGAEATFDVDVSGWLVRANATWVDPRNEVGRNAGRLLPRRARVTGRLDLDRAFGDFTAGLSVSGAGERYDDVANRNRLGGYGLVDLRLGYVINPAWSVQVTAGNVFDRAYETARFYNQPGRHYLFTVRYRPAR